MDCVGQTRPTGHGLGQLTGHGLGQWITDQYGSSTDWARRTGNSTDWGMDRQRISADQYGLDQVRTAYCTTAHIKYGLGNGSAGSVRTGTKTDCAWNRAWIRYGKYVPGTD
jgi:hypothetical protein